MAAGAIVAPLVGAGLQTLNYFQSRADQEKAQKKLDEYSKQPLGTLTANPALNRYYQSALGDAINPMGYTGAERGRYFSNLTGNLNANRQYATSMSGGNAGKAINFLDNKGFITGLSDFAANDAALARQNRNSAYGRQFGAASMFQGIDNANINAKNQRLLQLLATYGEAVRSNKDYQRNLVGGAGRDLTSAGLAMTDFNSPEAGDPSMPFYMNPSRYTDINYGLRYGQPR